MTSAVDRTSDFIRSVQLSRTKLTEHLKSSASSNFQSDYISSNSSVYSSQWQKPTTSDSVNLKGFVGGLEENGSIKPNRLNTINQRSQFMKAAAVIGQDLTNTFSKLEKLNDLARKQTLFDDHSTEIQQLTYIIKESMANLNNRIGELQKVSKTQVTGGKQRATHSRSVLVGLQTRLAKMSDRFRTLLEHRSDSIRSQTARKGKYSALDSTTSNSNIFGSEIVKPKHVVIPSVLLKDEERAKQSFQMNGDNSLENLESGPSNQLLTTTHLGLAQKQINLDQTDSYLASRADTMRSIEHTIVELGQIFQQLATMVHEQEESIHRIDSNVNDAALSIEAGHSELLRYFRSISSNRWLMIKIFCVLFIFFIIFVVFFA